MPDVLMALGTTNAGGRGSNVIHGFYVPSLGETSPSFEVLQRDSTYTWTSQPRLNRDPAMQFTGPGEEIILVEGRFFPKFFGGLSTIRGLQDSGRAGYPMFLVRYRQPPNGNGLIGEVVGGGRWVIRRVRAAESRIGPDGIAHKIDFSLELARFGEDQESRGTPFQFTDTDGGGSGSTGSGEGGGNPSQGSTGSGSQGGSPSGGSANSGSIPFDEVISV